MQCAIKYKPAFAAIFVTLEPGDTITAEAGAMVSMASQLTMKTEFSGGLFPALMRKFFGGESLIELGNISVKSDESHLKP